MSRKTAIIGSLLALAISSAFAQKASSAANLTAEQVVEKNIAARGGLSAWHAVQTLSMSGKMQAGGNDQQASSLRVPGAVAASAVPKQRPAEQVWLTFRKEMKRPHKSRFELDFRGEPAVQVFDGTNGWRLRPFLNRHQVEPYTPDQLKDASRELDLDGPLVDYAAKGTKIAVEGVEKVEGQDNYRLKLTFKSGESLKVWVNAQTFLETKIEGLPRRLDGKMHTVEVYYRDYKPVSGLMMPYLLETVTQGVKQTEKTEIEKITVNPKLDDTRFAKLQ